MKKKKKKKKTLRYQRRVFFFFFFFFFFKKEEPKKKRDQNIDGWGNQKKRKQRGIQQMPFLHQPSMRLKAHVPSTKTENLSHLSFLLVNSGTSTSTIAMYRNVPLATAFTHSPAKVESPAIRGT
eukprot:NODE_2385_length_933_cov_27.451357_g129_i20.p2 GENE.NODE_2385_length_933_cov_27.451357_g129_i20~~NODE_2385_length_933_cov_27.451357_g129_i20.p2  ORF type:complete len:124 (+),score=45.90 NODE_2385_length_933_cov_27.451357_g129_i20:317-688(+)